MATCGGIVLLPINRNPLVLEAWILESWRLGGLEVSWARRLDPLDHWAWVQAHLNPCVTFLVKSNIAEMPRPRKQSFQTYTYPFTASTEQAAAETKFF